MRQADHFLLLLIVMLSLDVANLQAQSVPFLCRDLPDAGIIIVPPSSPDYGKLLKDIQDQVASLPAPIAGTQLAGSAKNPSAVTNSAILLNQSTKPVVLIEVEWRFDYASGRTMSSGRTLLSRDSLLPIPDSFPRQRAYWDTILPGSKRYISEAGIAGANTDVRPPGSDESWTSSLVTKSATQVPVPRAKEPLKSVTLILDGVFFQDGEFAGPDRDGLWESVTSESDTWLAIARIARAGKTSGKRASDIFREITELIGPPTGMAVGTGGRGAGAGDLFDASDGSRLGSVRHRLDAEASPLAIETQKTQILIADDIERRRRSLGDKRLIDLLAATADSPVVDFRRR